MREGPTPYVFPVNLDPHLVVAASLRARPPFTIPLRRPWLTQVLENLLNDWLPGIANERQNSNSNNFRLLAIEIVIMLMSVHTLEDC